MRTSYEGHCKDCGHPFFFSSRALSSDLARGLSAPERCPDCRLKNRRYIKSVGAAYWEAPLETDDAKRCWGQYGLGRLVHDQGKPEAHNYEGVPIDQPPLQFQIIAGITESLITNLESPGGTQVSILVGPTGTGKSTWAPYRILRSALGERGRICVTQPRTVTLRPRKGVSKRAKAGRAGIDGETVIDPELALDEATYDLDDSTTPGYIARHLLKAPGVGAGHEVGFKFRGVSTQQDHYTKLLFVTDGILINWIVSGEIGQFSVVFIDEAHEQSVNMELIFALLKHKLPLHPNLKVVIASATVDVERFAGFFGDGDASRVFIAAPDEELTTNHEVIDRWPDDGESFASPLDLQPLSSDEPREVDRLPDLIARVVESIRKRDGFTKLGLSKGDILAFVPTIRLAERTVTAIDQLGISDLDTFVCHAQMSEEENARFKKSEKEAASAFAQGSPGRRQRVIVATSFAETSVTLNNLRYVIESGYILQPTWDTASSSYQYNVAWHTQAGCTQRRGRLGRKQPGECFRLYESTTFSRFVSHPLPELARSPLDMVLLKAKVAGIEDLSNFEWLGRPDDAEVQRAQRALVARGATDSDGDITNRGVELQSIETSTVDLALFMSESDTFGCALEVATFLAMVGQPGTYLCKGDDAILGFHRIRQGCTDDLEFYLRLFHLWAKMGESIRSLGVEPEWMDRAAKTRDRILAQFSRQTHTGIQTRILDLNRLARVRLVLAKCMPEWICIRTSPCRFHLDSRSHNQPNVPFEIDRDSCCVGDAELEAFVCVERSLTRSGDRLMARHVVRIDRDWISKLSAGKIQLALLLQETKDSSGCGTPGSVTAPLSIPAIHRFTRNQEVELRLIRPAGVDSESGEEIWLGEHTGTSAAVLVRKSSSWFDVGKVIRGHVEHVRRDRDVPIISQDRVRQSLDRSRAYEAQAVSHAVMTDGRLSGIRYELVPGVIGFLGRRHLGQMIDGWLGEFYIGSTQSVRIAEESTSGHVIEPLFLSLEAPDFAIGERCTAFVVFLKQGDYGDNLFAFVEIFPGITGFLGRHNGDLSRLKVGQQLEVTLLEFSSEGKSKFTVAINKYGDL